MNLYDKEPQMIHTGCIYTKAYDPLTFSEILEGERRIAEHFARNGFTAPTIEEMQEAIFRREAHEDTDAIVARMDIKEQTAIAYTPLVISQIAWSYADEALKQARLLRLKELRPFSSRLKDVREQYEELLLQDLDPAHITAFKRETARFMETCSYDFMVLYYSMNSEIKRISPNAKYDAMATFANIAIFMVEMLRQHTHQISELLVERLGPGKGSIVHPLMLQMEKLMSHYTCGVSVGPNRCHIQQCAAIFKNKISRIQFTPV